MTQPTKTEIEAEIKALRALKPKVRKTTFFGDSNWDAIEAQITVLELSLSQENIDKNLDEEAWTEYEYNNALDARAWLDGERENSLSGEWKELAK